MTERHILEAALAYAASGLRVIPVHGVVDGRCTCIQGAGCGKSAGKHPTLDRWQDLASADQATIRRWFEDKPYLNLGIATGGPARVIALDIDGAKGRASIETLVAEHAPLPHTFTTRSGRTDGGEHRFYRVPESLDLDAIRNQVGRLGAGVDVRANRGQVVAPPSLHASGARYVIEDDAPIAELPLWLYELMTAPASRALPAIVPQAAPRRDVPSTDRARRARAYLDRVEGAVEGEAVHSGGRTGGTHTFVTAQKIGLGFDLDEETTFALLSGDWNARCSPPWEDGALRRAVQEAFRAGGFECGSLLDAPLPIRERTAAALSVLEGVLARLGGLSKAERGAAALAPDIVKAAAELQETSPEWTRFYDGLKALGVGVNPWKRAVRGVRAEERRAKRTAEQAKRTADRPEIIVSVEEGMTKASALAALPRAEGVYQRGGSLVDIVRDQRKTQWVKRAGGAPRIRLLPLASLRIHLTEVGSWVQWSEDKQTGERTLEPVHPPDWAYRAVHVAGAWPDLPYLTAISECPILRPDGTILDVPGYDEATGILYEPRASFPAIPARPSPTEAMKARDELLDLVKDFPFESEAARSAWIAGALTPFARHCIDGPTPMFLVNGNVRGCGKTLLASIAAEIGTGREPALISHVEDEDEERKRITCIALDGDPVVLFDNIGKQFGSPTLDGALTARSWGERALGGNDRPRLPLLCTWWATGNNVTFKGDTARRCCLIRLDSPLERPETRTDVAIRDLTSHVRRSQPRFVSAALTILRAAHIHDAAAYVSTLEPWSPYEEWTRVVRAAVVWLGLPDPGLVRGSADDSADPDAQSLATLLDGWGQLCADLGGDRGAVSSKDALEALQREDEERASAIRQGQQPRLSRWPKLREALAELVPGLLAGRLPNVKQLAYQLRRFEGRVVGGRRLQNWKSDGVRVWMVAKAKLVATRAPTVTEVA